ncbi:hypothetical protein ACP4OV_022351 [Aristida adscensionis]
MSLVRRSNVFDPFSLDLWDPFDSVFRSVVPSAAAAGDRDTAAFANARIDWKETCASDDLFGDDPEDPDYEEELVGFEGEGIDTVSISDSRIEVPQTPEAHVFMADLPGVKEEEVKVEVEDGNVLVISGERSKEKEDKNDTWHRVERSSGQFMRRFRLPENARVDQVKAGLENGVLTVTVPKAEMKKPEVKAIEISG